MQIRKGKALTFKRQSFCIGFSANWNIKSNTKQLAIRNSEKFRLRTFCTLHSRDRYQQA